ncbi:MAG: S41 family peptidase, partial [Planctomycetota bacterium]
EKKLDEAAIQGMLSIATDRYTQYIPPSKAVAYEYELEGRFTGVGVELDPFDEGPGLLVALPIPGSPADEAGVRSGDRFVAVDGTSLDDYDRNGAIELVKGLEGTDVTLTIRRDEQDFDLTMQRAAVSSPPLQGFRRNDDGTPSFWVTPPSDIADPTGSPKIGYIYLQQFTPNLAEIVRAKIDELAGDGMQGLILDLRLNGGGLLGETQQLMDHFLPGGVMVWAEGKHYPKRLSVARPEATLLDLPIVVLIDGRSASASEVFAGAMSDWDRATVVGTRSFGKGSVQQPSPTPAGGTLTVTTAYYHLPSGRIVHRNPRSAVWGVDPDVPATVDYADPSVRPTRDAPFAATQVWAAYEVLLAMLADGDAGESTLVPRVDVPNDSPTGEEQ